MVESYVKMSRIQYAIPIDMSSLEPEYIDHKTYSDTMENYNSNNVFERLSENIQDLLDRNCTKGQFFDNVIAIMADASEQDLSEIKEYLYPSSDIVDNGNFTNIIYYKNSLLQK